ncbi:hypothetical protein MED121_16214 [Marinomonas sp. MED121]|nr:hypothetical protein MED121_16214 [Marinomonas sp. MED121]
MRSIFKGIEHSFAMPLKKET